MLIATVDTAGGVADVPIIIFLVASELSALDTTPVVVEGSPNLRILKPDLVDTVEPAVVIVPSLLEASPNVSSSIKYFVTVNTQAASFIPSAFLI